MGWGFHTFTVQQKNLHRRFELASQAESVGYIPWGGLGLWLSPTLPALPPQVAPSLATPQRHEISVQTDAPVSSNVGDDVLLRSPQGHSPCSPPPPRATKRVTFISEPQDVSRGVVTDSAPLLLGGASTESKNAVVAVPPTAEAAQQQQGKAPPICFVDEDEDTSNDSFGIIEDDVPSTSNAAAAQCHDNMVRRLLKEAPRPFVFADEIVVEIDLDDDPLSGKSQRSTYGWQASAFQPYSSLERSFGVVPVTKFQELEL